VSSARIEQLLAEFWSRRDAGEVLQPSEFLAAHPEHALQLRPALQALLGVASMLPTVEMPTQIGGYEVRGRLGRGATGEVFAVVDANGAPRALKRLLPHIGPVARAQQRLQREAEILRALHHRGIVEIFDVGEDEAAGGVPFVVMEQIDGRSLAEVVTAARATAAHDLAELPGPGDRWQRVARCVARLAAAVAAAHEVSVLHRDLKPGNVLLRGDGTPVVVDFGLAADAGSATLTGTGDILGTPHYMAPEQARGEPATVASDVYGLGTILYELLTLQPPRHGSDPLQVLDLVRSVPPPGPRAVQPSVPRELDLIARRAMAFRPGHRYATAAALGHALELVAQGGRPVGLTLGVPQRLDDAWRRHKRPLLGAAGVLFVAVSAWWLIDIRQAAAAERLRSATIVAAQCHLDGDAEGLAGAAADMAAAGEVALANWMLGIEASPAPQSAFLHELTAGCADLPQDPRAAMRAFERALAARPQSPIAAAWLGLAAAEADQFEVAERELSAAIRVLPASVRLRVEFARALRKTDRIPAAVDQLRHAVQLPRATAETWHELAKVCNYDGDSQSALEAVQTAIDRNGGPTVSMLRTKAIIFAGLQRHEEAATILADVVARTPTPNSWTSYGATLDRLHRLRQAADAYGEALALDAGHVPALLNLVYLHSGSDREHCERCRLFFVTHPEVLDADLADDFAARMLQAEEGDFATIEQAARMLRRVGPGERLLAGIDARLEGDLPALALGRLLRTRRVLRGP